MTMDQQPPEQASSPPQPPPPPVLIVGAGVSGLLLAQYLRRAGVPYELFERDADAGTRGIGWGLTLHWSLPSLRSLLPAELVRRLPEAYVDRAAVERDGLISAFPFFDLRTGELRAATPPAPESARIRVSRDRLRRLLADGVDIQWGKQVAGFDERPGPDGKPAVTIHFEDGSSRDGRVLVACDGGNSRIRRSLLQKQQQQQQEDGEQRTVTAAQLGRFRIPVCVMGVRVCCTPAQVRPLRELDPFFLQGSSPDDVFIYFSVLDSPGSPQGNKDNYSCQLVVSWPMRDDPSGDSSSSSSSPSSSQPPAGRIAVPPTNDGRLALIRKFATAWAEPFRSFASSIPDDTEVLALDLYDWAPPPGFRGSGPVALLGDAFHPMAMYRGEGANHAILDVADFAELVAEPHLLKGNPSSSSPSAAANDLRAALDEYERRVVDRARPGVLASRRACLDAHEWGRINERSPLLTRRAMKVDFDESDL